jgi:hydrogenase maturation protease
MRDDQAGLLVAQQLGKRGLQSTAVVCAEAPGDELIPECAQDVDLLVVIDAARADADHPPGSFARFDYRDGPALVSTGSRYNTHTLSVDAGLELAAALGVLPERVWVYAVFGRDFQRGFYLDPDVATCVDSLVARIETDIADWLAEGPRPRHG